MGRLKPGDTTEVAGYQIAFVSVRHEEGPNYSADEGVFEIRRDGQTLSEQRPQKRQYSEGTNVQTEAGIEPGAFRTDWASRSMKESGTPIADYADVAARKDLIKQFADHLPGDPRKVAEAVLMVTRADDPPLRLLLGRDVLKAVRDRLAAFSASIEEWAPVTKDVNFPS